jgi:hypothetical protein
MKTKIIVEVISFLYITLFIYAAMTKILDYEKFQVQLNQSPLLMAFTNWIAIGIPAIELLIAALLITSRYRLIAFYMSFTLMVVFTVYILVILSFADHVPCSCGGILEKMGWTEHLFFNIAFVALAAWAVLLNTKNQKNSNTGEQEKVKDISLLINTNS